MAELLLSTTGTASPVVIDDLGGRSFTHPVTDLDLLLEYSHSTIMGSADLNTKVAAGEITLTDADGVAFTVVQDQAPIKNNFDASAPTVNDDIDAGYSKDSLWVKSDAPIAIFVCLDNTAGAADWQQIATKFENITIKSSNYTALATDDIIIATAAITITLPPVAGLEGLPLTVHHNSASGVVTVDGDGSETINGQLTAVLSSRYDFITFFNAGTEWLSK